MKYIPYILLLLTSCVKNKTVSPGDEVFLLFKLNNSQGKRIDSSFLPSYTQPLRVIAGQDYLIKDFDLALLGMREKEKKQVKIPPEKAFADNGLFYCDTLHTKTYILNPDEPLVLEIEVLKINKP